MLPLLLTAPLLFLAMGSVNAAQQDHPAAHSLCSGTEIRVAGADAREFQDVCAGVAAARSFFLTHGLRNEPTVTVVVTPKLPEVVGSSAAGCFLQEKSRAYVLSYAEFKKKRTWFGVAITRTLYRSLATHEVAHAIAACHFTAPEPSIQAKEYVAYVTMFSAMPTPLRINALKSFPGTGFTDINRVSSFVYLFDPMRFGAEAYRHFVRLDDGAGFLRDVMSGKVLAE
jgi:hypothetical protein